MSEIMASLRRNRRCQCGGIGGSAESGCLAVWRQYHHVAAWHYEWQWRLRRGENISAVMLIVMAIVMAKGWLKEMQQA